MKKQGGKRPFNVKSINEELSRYGYAIRKEGPVTSLYRTNDNGTVEMVKKLYGNLPEVRTKILEFVTDSHAAIAHQSVTIPGVGNRFESITINRQFEHLRKFVRLVVNSRSTDKNLVICAGPGAIGKSYEILDTLDSTVGPDNYVVIKANITPVQLFNKLHEHNGKVIVLDDADVIFDNDMSVNVLKAVTDTNRKTGRREVNWESNSQFVTVNSFNFTGKVIAISNRDFAKPNMARARPLITRSYFIQFKSDREQILDRTRMIASNTDHDHLTIEERLDVVDYIDSFKDFLPDLRLYNGICELRTEAKFDPEIGDWRDIAESLIYSKQFLD